MPGLAMRFLGHSTVRVELAGTVVLTDPTDSFAHCPDVLIHSRPDPVTEEASAFEPHVGSPGGLGGPQSRGFLLYPAELPAPGEVVGTEALRDWLTHLGHPRPHPEPEAAQRGESSA